MIPSLVVTSWSDEGGAIYGNRFLSGFWAHWRQPHGIRLNRWWDAIILEDPEVRAFREREADSETSDPTNIHRGVMKWSWKVFALTMEPMPTSGWMIWIDGDVEFIKTPTQEFFNAVCPEDKDVSFLARPWAYASETGFVAYRMDCPEIVAMLRTMRSVYTTGEFRKLDEWGDAAVFDFSRSQYTALRQNNLARDATPGQLHVWPDTVLAEFLTHRKGPKRKKEAYGGAV